MFNTAASLFRCDKVEADRSTSPPFYLICIAVVNQFQISVLQENPVRNAHRVIEFSLQAPRNGFAISLSSLLPNFLQKHTSYVAPNWLAKYFIRYLGHPLYLIDRRIIRSVKLQSGPSKTHLISNKNKKNTRRHSLKIFCYNYISVPLL